MKDIILVWILFHLGTINGISDGEASFLIAMKASTNVESIVSGWTQPVEYFCNYTGIYCSGETINSIVLQDNEITGFIPPEIGNLTNTYYISMIGGFTGQIPSEIGQLSGLETLLLSGRLSGPIPRTIGNLEALNYLLLYGNELNGSIPQELRNLYNLMEINLSNNTLIGEIPLFESGLLFSCDLRYNQLCYSDYIPEEKRCQVNVSCSSVTTAPTSTSDPTTAFVTTAMVQEVEGDDDGCGQPDCGTSAPNSIIGFIDIIIIGSISICFAAFVISLVILRCLVMRKRRNKTQNLMIVEISPDSIAMESKEQKSKEMTMKGK